MNAIRTKQLTKYYGDIRGIEDVNLEVESGEIFGFIGPNGAGKSTTIRVLLGLIYPNSGQAEIFGKDILKYGPEIKQYIGYLPSEVFYYDDMRVIDLLKYSASFYDKNQKSIYKRIQYLAELLDLDLDKKIDSLSYGNKKKVGIIQAIAHEPKLIILDEPTSGLDPLVQQKFFYLLKQENKKGSTILFSSHVLSEVQKLCSRVAIIKDGTIIKVEEISSLINNNYKRFTIETTEKISKKVYQIPGVSDLTTAGNQASFLYRGNLNTIQKVISGLDLVNLTVEDPDLEEIFLHYYG